MTELPQPPDLPEPADASADPAAEPAEDHLDDAGATPGAEAEPRTGEARVDAVLDSLDGLREAPVETHVPIFERAHEELRAALDAPADEPPADDAAPA